MVPSSGKSISSDDIAVIAGIAALPRPLRVSVAFRAAGASILDAARNCAIDFSALNELINFMLSALLSRHT